MKDQLLIDEDMVLEKMHKGSAYPDYKINAVPVPYMHRTNSHVRLAPAQIFTNGSPNPVWRKKPTKRLRSN